ncbi:MAG: phospholipid carrier-dependent glycosyltransferase [Chloroflexota bacterium]
MNRFQIKTETSLYLSAFLLAAAFRFAGLGVLPLGDAEAEWALQALHLAQGTRPLLGPQPAYVLPTGSLFFLFGATNFLARLLPALTGSLLVALPFLFRDRLKPAPGLLLAFFLALDPGLVALSRQAGSPMPALAFTLLAWASWWKGHPRMAGALAGLALLSGPALWPGLLGMGLAWGIWRVTQPHPAAPAGEDGETPPTPEALIGDDTSQGGIPKQRSDLQSALTVGGATMLLGGTLFFLSPNGLSAWLSSLPTWLGGWSQPSGVPVERLLFAPVIYQPLAIICGLVAIVRGGWQGRRRYIRLGVWFGIALLLALLYPARQVGDLAWALIPLWALAALELSNHLRIFPEERREVTGMGLLVALFLVFAWLNYTSIALDPYNPANAMANGIQFGGKIILENLPPTRYLLLGSVLILLVVSILLVALGWSARIARLASVWGLATALGMYALGVAWGATGLRTPDGWELWQSPTRPAQADLLLAAVNEMSEWSAGDGQAQEVILSGLDSPALSWLLREHSLRSVTALDIQQSPAIVLTAEQESLDIPSAYRGQDFAWRQSPSWDILSTNDWIRWSVFRKLPYDSDTVIVWVRADLFPDAHPSLP